MRECNGREKDIYKDDIECILNVILFLQIYWSDNRGVSSSKNDIIIIFIQFDSFQKKFAVDLSLLQI